MELLQLKYFCDAAQTENFSKTAKKHNVPPSNISQSIKRLETEIQTNLFNRKANSLTLSNEGKIFYTKVAEALNLIEAAKTEITDNSEKGTLKICILTNRTTVMKTVEEFTKKHPEVVALVSYGKGKCLVVEDKKDVKNVKKTDIIYIVSQTTQSPKMFEEIVNEISKISQVKVFNTICRATFDRQSAAAKLAKEVDVMIVIGGKNSGNTTRLYQICSNITKTYHIENVDEIETDWFNNIETVGITAGASTPDWIIENIKRRIKEITNC